MQTQRWVKLGEAMSWVLGILPLGLAWRKPMKASASFTSVPSPPVPVRLRIDAAIAPVYAKWSSWRAVHRGHGFVSSDLAHTGRNRATTSAGVAAPW